jgi:ATP-dependent DNA helicase RecG
MFKSLEKICQIFEIESQGHFQNRTIIGGFERFLPNFLPQLRSENVPQELIKKIENELLHYGSSAPGERSRIIRELSDSICEQTSKKINEGATLPATNHSSRNAPVTRSNGDVHQTSQSQNKAGMDKPSMSSLSADIAILPGIGPAKKALFAQMGVKTVEEILYFFPRRYDDYSKLKPINRLEYGETLTVIATVQSTLTTPMRNRDQSRVEVVVSDGTGFLRLVFFRGSKYIRSFESQFQHGRQLVISGKVQMYLGRLQMDNPSYEDLDQTHLSTNGIIPVYPLTSGLSQKAVRNAISEALNFHLIRIHDYLPDSIKQDTGLINLSTALQQVHYPQSAELLEKAQNRIAFDEIFFLQLGVLQQKQAWTSQSAQKYLISDSARQAFINSLPFTLTSAQLRVIDQMIKDLSSGFPMNRLLQGDVGSGKTIIAAFGIFAMILNGAQSTLMAPTGILAEQHYQTLSKILLAINLPDWVIKPEAIRLLTGDSNQREREEIVAGLADGSIKILIGTHALIEDPIKFNNLQFVIIDEQHRFGISQRASLRKKGTNPHLLVMSATPIPRSLALTLYGDLDLSIMDEMPVGRKPVDTHILSPLERERAYQIIRAQIKLGHQAFIVYPLIESNEITESKAVVEDYDILSTEIFPDLKIGLLHGRLSAEEKEKVMSAFHENRFPLLVSTTVIEVGVDIPNATIMMIEGANRFGLAQLHQLRGRVGRNQEQSMCLLIPEGNDASENERLKAMVQTNDGFVLAEKDLQQRGPGDFIGYRQSGFADLKMAKITDIRLIEKARKAAESVFSMDPCLKKPENALLLQKLNKLWNSEKSDIS